MVTHSIRLSLLLIVLLLSACWGTKPALVLDSGPESPVDVSQIHDAVVTDEPKSRFGNPDYYEIAGVRYFVLNSSAGYKQTGIGSWYGKKFHGRRTSSGEIYNMYAMTAAHTTLPLPTYVRVTNLENGKKVVVKVNDRGPFLHNRIIDLSYTAATKLGYVRKGTAKLEVVALTPGVAVAGSKDSYLVQLGAFSDEVKSKALATEIEAKLNTRVEISALQSSDKLLYRLRLGPFLTRTEAREWLAKVLANGFSSAKLVTSSDRWHNL